MLRPLQDRERGLCGSPLAFTKAAYVAALPTIRMKGSLKHHSGCVNHISFSESGDTLLSGSDDTLMAVWDVERRKLRGSVRTGHSANIFCTKHMPATGDRVAVTCAGDSEVRVHDLTAGRAMEIYTHHDKRVKKLVTEAGNPSLIISAAEDGTVRQLDRRQPSGGPAVLVYVRSHGGNRMMELNSICSPAQRPNLFAVGGGDPWLRVFDRRVTSSVGRVKAVAMYSPAVGNPDYFHDTITGVACSADGRWVVGNYLDDAVYLFPLDGNDAPPAAAEPPAPVGRSLRRARRSMYAEGTQERDEAMAEAAEEGTLEDAIDAQLDAQRSRMPGQSSRQRAEVLAARAGRFRREGRVAEAVVCAAAALRLSPRLGRAFFELAACHEASGNYDAALRDVELAKGLCWSQELEDLEERLRAHFAEQFVQGAVVATHRAVLAVDSDPGEAEGGRPSHSIDHGHPRSSAPASFIDDMLDTGSRPRRRDRRFRAAMAQTSSAAALAELPRDRNFAAAAAAASLDANQLTPADRQALSGAAAAADVPSAAAQEAAAAPFHSARAARDTAAAAGDDSPAASETEPEQADSDGSGGSQADSLGRLRRRGRRRARTLAAAVNMEEEDIRAIAESMRRVRQEMLANSSSSSSSSDSDMSDSYDISEGDEVWIDEETVQAIAGEPTGFLEAMSAYSDDDSDGESNDDSAASAESLPGAAEAENALENYLAGGWDFVRMAQNAAEEEDNLDYSGKEWGTDCESDSGPAERGTGRVAEVGRKLIDGEPPRDPPCDADGVEQGYVMRYRGHINQQTIKDVAFVGPDDSAIAAGSDCGRMFLWDRASGRLLTAVRSDREIVNCIAAHPHEPLLAACGLDSSVKLWVPHYGVHRLGMQRRYLEEMAGKNAQKMAHHRVSFV